MSVIISEEEHALMHYGILRKSGRYPWGSGKDAETRSRDFLGTVDDLKSKGMTDAEIMRGFGMNTTDFRAAKSIANSQKKAADIGMAQRLKDKGYSNIEIGKRMGINESSVRSLLAPGLKDRVDNLQTIANMLKDEVAQKTYLDIGTGTENKLGISKEKLKTAVAMLKEEGYHVGYTKVRQLGTGLDTSLIVLAPPGTTNSEIYHNKDKIQTIGSFSKDGGRTFYELQPPLSISSKRIAVKYKEDGGADADGVLYIRPGVKDVSIGTNRYAQVRVAVDGTHYIKGMAIYKNDLPPGVDIVFNTNKSNTGNKLDALKEMNKTEDGKTDLSNPFTTSIKRQIIEKNSRGKDVVTSAMNIVNEEGSWGDWTRTLSTQVLSKQSPKLVKEQLEMTFEKRKNELDGILALTNPTVRKKLLESYADATDSSAVHLEAHRLPRSSWHVILPIKSMKENEVYAPNFRNGEKVALIRFPHAGTFEIPELTVNNRHPEAKSVLGPATSGRKEPASDAIGIHPKVAERLSGADFDGDAVMVIPNNTGKIKTSPPLEKLKGFDPQREYKLPDDAPHMTSKIKGHQMGLVSNLITDMTIVGASTQEISQAVRHSMVVIDAEKHHLDWKRSAKDHGIPALMKKYQIQPGGRSGGGATLISRATSEKHVPMRRPSRVSEGGPIDRKTGKRNFTPTGETKLDPKTGKQILVTFKSTKLAETDNAHTLSSGTPVEKVYADHSNRLKALANKARKEYINTTPIAMSPSAKSVYHEEVKKLNHALNVAKMNAPLERQAQLIANAQVRLKKQANPNMDHATRKKIEAQALKTARARVQAKKQLIEITDRDWEAIQAGAISNNQLSQILNNTDLDRVKKLATPRHSPVLSTSEAQRAKSMIAAGYTQSEIADQLGVSLTTLKTNLGGE